MARVCGSDASVNAGDAVRAAGDDVLAGHRAVRARRRGDAGGRRRAGQRQRPRGAGGAAGTRGRAVDRRRAGRRRLAAGARSDPREQQDDAGRPAGRGRVRRRSTSASCATTRQRSRPRCAVRPTECDAIVTSGGVSMGDYDVVKAVLSRIADMRWMQVAIRPAKPFAFGLLDDGTGRQVPVFGLPGNPVSSLVSFELFARPGLRQMMGHTVDRPPHRAGDRRRGDRAPARRQDPLRPGASVRSAPTAATTCAPVGGPGQPPAGCHRLGARPSPWCPTATACGPAARSTSSCCR